MTSARLALVGAGGIAQAYMDVISSVADTELVAIVEPVAERAEAAIARVPGAVVVPDFTALLERSRDLDVHGVLICAPPNTHAALAVAALDGGLQVMCEKPLAPNRAQAHQMLDAAHRNRRVLMMASKFRYVDDVAHAKQLIDSGELGEIVLFRNAFTSVVSMSARWNSDPTVSGGGVIIDNGTHSVDVARYLLGPIREVIATETKRVQHLAVEDTAQVLFRTDAGATGTIDLSWSLHTGSPWYCTIDGSRASIRLGWTTAEIHRGSGHDWQPIGTGYSKTAAFSRQICDFRDAIRCGKCPIITPADAHASVAVIDAAYTSMATQQWETVVEERRRAPRS